MTKNHTGIQDQQLLTKRFRMIRITYFAVSHYENISYYIHMKPLFWTQHSREKMNFYRLSESRVKRVINRPDRIEEGIAPKTVAVMQSVKTSKRPYEIWVMIQDERKSRKVISAWRYPGTTKPGEPLPKEILKEIANIN